MSNFVLDADDMSYQGMVSAGRVTINFDDQRGAVVTVDGFEFDSPQTCRTHIAKSMAWARDVLAAAVEADRLVPGGYICSGSGMDQESLESSETSEVGLPQMRP